MSAGEPSDTIPPPLGEDDAYSATTKVGAMPAELMAKLRAEGLLPSEGEERKGPPRPKGPEKQTPRSMPVAAAHDSMPPPSLISTRPSKDDETLLRPEATPPPPPARLPSLSDEDAIAEESFAGLDGPDDDAPHVEAVETEASIPPEEVAAPPDVRPVVETPVAFASPSAALLTSESIQRADSLPAAAAAGASSSVARPSQTGRVLVFLAIVGLVVAALIMALSGHGR